jgi:hypothetical protein
VAVEKKWKVWGLPRMQRDRICEDGVSEGGIAHRLSFTGLLLPCRGSLFIVTIETLTSWIVGLGAEQVGQKHLIRHVGVGVSELPTLEIDVVSADTVSYGNLDIREFSVLLE